MKKDPVVLRVDGLKLKGEIYKPEYKDASNPAICFCHGIPAGTHNPDERGYSWLAEKFCNMGFVSLIFNFRGTGQSEGNFDIYKWSRDLKTAVDFLCSLNAVNRSNISLIGFSGGAAVGVYWAAHDVRISSIAALACPSDFGFMSDYRAKSLLEHFRSIGIIKSKFYPKSIKKWLEGFEKISPIQWIDKISPRPVLLVHGDKDDVVPVEHALKLYEQANEPKQIAVINGAGHRLRLEERAIGATLAWIKGSLIDPSEVKSL